MQIMLYCVCNNVVVIMLQCVWEVARHFIEIDQNVSAVFLMKKSVLQP